MWMLLWSVLAMAADPAEKKTPKNGEMQFDSETLVLLVKGPKWSDADTPENRELMKGHLAHFGKLQEQGHLLLCGPFGDRDDPNLRGLCVYRGDVESSRKLAEDDPRVKAGHLTVVVQTFWHEKGAVTYPMGKPPK